MLVKLNKNIYSRAAVEEAVGAFKKIAGLKVGQNARYFLVEAKNIQPDLKDIFFDEFCNFVLSADRK